jgi:hypothetical protein
MENEMHNEEKEELEVEQMAVETSARVRTISQSQPPATVYGTRISQCTNIWLRSDVNRIRGFRSTEVAAERD